MIAGVSSTSRRRLAAALLALLIGATGLSATGCVGQLGRNDDRVQPGSKGPSAANK